MGLGGFDSHSGTNETRPQNGGWDLYISGPAKRRATRLLLAELEKGADEKDWQPMHK